MKQVNYQLNDISCLTCGESSPSGKFFSSKDHLTIGNLVFETNPYTQISQEEYYNSVLIAKQNVLPLSCIQERKKQGIIESFFSYKRSNLNQFNTLNELQLKIMNMNLEQQYILQNYLQISYNQQGQCTSIENSDTGSNSHRGSFSLSQDIETKESAFSLFIERDLGLNGKSQIFQYTVVQCIDDELEPYIQRKGISEAFISLLGSSRNHYQQMIMRIGTYESHEADIRQQTNISLLRSHIQCYELAKIAKSQVDFSQNSQMQSDLSMLMVSPIINNCQSYIETFEKFKLECQTNITVIPCIFNGQLLGFVQLERLSILPAIVKKLMADRKMNRISIPNFWNEQEYNIKSEIFLQKMESYKN